MRTLIALLICAAFGESAITLTAVPAGMRKQNMDITVGWTGGGGRVHLRASTAPGGGASITHYDSLHLPSQMDAGSFTFKINPDIPVAYRNTDLRFGVNYCIVTDGVQSSPEFVIIVESSVAPTLTSPANAANIKDLTPTFAWSGDAPYYAMLVSDEPFKISEDGTVSGVSAIWQIITPFTTARYGDADPSGFNTVAAPPLISGKTYNWLVLNNYGNNAGATSKVAPVPFSFVYLPAPPLPQAELIEPKDKDSIPGVDAIDFRWALVEGAVSYKLEILEENLVEGSQADVILWKASSTGGQVRLENATGTLRRYTYKWRVYAIGSNGSASLSVKRSFFYAITVGNMNISLKDGKGQKLAYVPIKVNRLGGASSAVFQNGSTDADGLLTINNAPLGDYEARVDNVDGFQPKADTFSHASASGTNYNMALQPVLGKIVGKVSSSKSGTGLLNAKVTVSASDGSEWTTLTNSQGNYSLGVPYANWQVKAQGDGHLASTVTTVSLNSGAPSKTADFTLAPHQFTLSGTIRNSFSSQGIFGATVFLSQGSDTRSINTDGNGAYSFTVASGIYTLRVSNAGFAAPEPQSVDISGDRTLNLSLDPNASILSGRTKDMAGTALSGVVVQATPKAGPTRDIVSDAQGYFELSLPAGDWSLTSSAKGFTPKTTHKFLLDISKTVQGVDFMHEANRSSVSGRVIENGTGLPGARVYTAEASGLTDNAGYYRFSVNAGTHLVQAQKEGYLVSKTYSVPMNPGDSVSGIDFTATGNAGVIKGKALSGGAGVTGARIEAVNQGNKEAFAVATAGDGSFIFSLPGGDYKLSASKEGFALDQAPVSLSLPPGGNILDANLRLVPDEGSITGSVSSGSLSLSGCEVTYKSATNAALSGRTVTDPQGRYSLSLQAGNAYMLSASCAGYQAAAATSANLPRSGTLLLDFNLSKAGSTVKGKTVDRLGALAGVKVTAERNGEAVSVVSDFSGVFQLSLGSGTYTFSFSKIGYRTLTALAELSSGDNARPADTLVSARGRITGRVLSDGAGVEGALATLVGLTPDAGGGVFQSDADGRFSQDNLPAGSYSLTVSATGYAEGKIASLTVVAEEATNAEVILAANRGVLSGTVEVTGTSPTLVRVVANSYGVSRSAVPAADGRWTIDKLPGGIYAVSAGLAGYSSDIVREGLSLGSSATLSDLKFVLSRNAGSLSGTVSGAGVATGIRVNLVGAKGTRAYGACDAAGRYSIPSLPEDTYTLTVSAPGYRLAGGTQAPEFAINSAQVRNVALEPAVFVIAGKMVNQTSLPISGMPVELRHPLERVNATTAADGSFSFAGVPAGGEYQVSFKPPTADYDAKDTLFARTLDQTGVASFTLATLSRLSSLSGSVLLDGSPVEGAVLRLSGNGNNQVALSQPGGVFKIPGVAGSESEVSLSVSKSGASTKDTTLVVKVVESRTGFTVRLKTVKIALSGTLSNSEGKPIPGGKAVLTGGPKPDTLTANQAGAFSIVDLAANQTLALITLLDKAKYDNVEIQVRLKEKDTAVAVTAVVHATSVALQVKDQDGALIDSAEVVMNGKALGRTANGLLQAKNLPRGEYRFVAGKASYRSSSETRLNLSGDTVATLDLILTRVVGGLYGSVGDSGLDRSGGGIAARKLVGAVVEVRSGGDTLRDTVNSLGQYFVNGLVAGTTYGISVVLPGYFPLRDSVIGNSQAQSRDFLLRPIPGAVAGQVGSGKSGVKVRLSQSSSGRILSSLTVTGGYFAFLGLQNRSDYLVQAFAGDSTTPPTAFQANGGATRRVDLSIDRWGGTEGKVSGAASGALPGTRVQARNSITGALAWTLTDASGSYSLAGLASGEYALSAERIGFRSSPSRTVTVTKGSIAKAVDLTLEESDAGITGVALDKSGNGLTGMVILSKGADTLRAGTGGGGQFQFSGLGAGDFVLSGTIPGFSPEAATVNYPGKGLALGVVTFNRAGNRILGVIRDAMTNTPLNGAVVRIAGTSSADAVADSLGRFNLAVSGTGNPVFLEASKAGYLTRTPLPVFREADGSAMQDLALTADYQFDGEINVTVKEGKDPVPTLTLRLQPFHPDDAAMLGLSGTVPFSFRNLRRPAPYTLNVGRPGFKDLSRVVELPAGSAKLDVVMSYPTSQIRIFVTTDGRKGQGVDVSLNGQRIQESPDTAGLYLSAAKLKPDRYEATFQDLDSALIPMDAHFIALGEDSVRTDTLFSSFRKKSIADSTIDAEFRVGLIRTDSVRPAPGVAAKIFYRLEGASLWDSLALDSVSGGFSKMLPAQALAGAYQYFYHVQSPAGIRIGVVTAAGGTNGSASATYSNARTPASFRLRDPFLLQGIALSPQRLEADTSLYSLSARDIFQVQLRGENGRSLDAYFDGKAAGKDTSFTVSWSFANPEHARSMGLSLVADSATPRLCRFRGGTTASDSMFQVICHARMASVRLKKSFLVKIQDLAPVGIGIKFVKENRNLEENGASLLLSNNNPGGYGFSAFARTSEGRIYNIAPTWSFGNDTAVGRLDQLGIFIPNPAVARSAVLQITDTLSMGGVGTGVAGRKPFSFQANLATYAQVVPASAGRSVVTNGEGTVLDFNLAGLTKAFTVSVKKPKVSGLLRSSPKEEVVGDILDIELSESQPFKADSGATLKMPVATGIARRSTVYLGHWNTSKLTWEKVAEAKADTMVRGTVYGFSKYAVLMGSLPLGAYDMVAKPNPFTALDPWGLQLGYKVSSDVSSQVGVRVEVFNMMGDKVYESQEIQLSKGQAVEPGTHKAQPNSSDRRSALGPFVWDGRDTKGVLCRNGRYLLKLIVKDGQGSKEYLKKVVMLK